MEPELQKSRSSGMSAKAVLLLLVLIVLAGYLVSQKEMPGLSLEDENVGAEETFNFAALTNDEKAALNAPRSATTSSAVVLAHTEAVNKVAIATNTVAIGSDCRTAPVVAKVQQGKTLQFKNYDSIPHTISFSLSRSVTVVAKGEVTVPVDFGEKFHIYGYGCELGASPIGMILIAE